MRPKALFGADRLIRDGATAVALQAQPVLLAPWAKRAAAERDWATLLVIAQTEGSYDNDTARQAVLAHLGRTEIATAVAATRPGRGSYDVPGPGSATTTPSPWPPAPIRRTSSGSCAGRRPP